MSIPFIQPAPGGKFRVCPEGAAALSKIRNKIAVVSVAGPYRTGKSFLLNRLVESSDGFKVGSTINACTKGIWLWGKPLTQDGVTYIFMDTEGLGSTDQESTFDTKMFSLSVLLSSLFVLNTQGTINEGSLDLLELVVECTKKIQVQEGGSSNMDSLAEEFPRFLWVLRDFVLRLQDEDGDDISASEYLEQSLRDVKGSGPRVESKNRVRQAIRSVFPKRDCVTLVRPVMDERQLQDIGSLPYKKLRKEFREGMEALRATVFHTAQPKTVRGSAVNGPALVRLAEAYVEAMNQGAVPMIRTAWESVVALQGRDAFDAARESYHKAMAAAFGNKVDKVMSEEALSELSARAEQDALAVLKEIGVGDDKQKAQLEAKLREEVQARFQELRNTNHLRSTAQAQKVAARLWKEHGLAQKEFDDVNELTKAFNALHVAYMGEAQGPACLEVSRQFLEEKRDECLRRMFQESQRKAKALEQEREAASKRLQEAEKARDKADAAATSATSEAVEARKEAARLAKKVEMMEKESGKASKDVEAVRAERDAALEKASALEKELKASQKEVGRLEKNIADMEKGNADLAKETKGSERRCQELQARVKEQEAAIKDLEGRLGDAASAQTSEVKALKKDVADKASQIKSLEKELKSEKTQVAELSAKIAELEAQVESLEKAVVEAAEAGPAEEEVEEAVEEKMAPAKRGRKRKAEEVEEEEEEAEEEDPAVVEAVAKVNKMKKNELKSWLTRLDVKLPPRDEKKAFYVNLLYKNDPLLMKADAPGQKKTKRARR